MSIYGNIDVDRRVNGRRPFRPINRHTQIRASIRDGLSAMRFTIRIPPVEIQ